MQTSLQGIAKRVQIDPTARFGGLYTMLNEQNLTECFYLLRKDGAVGVDKVDFKTYEVNLSENISDLVERLKRKSYKARLIKRTYIPKGDGKYRPLGIPILEDKLLQLAVSKILNAIWEPQFLDCSFGFRPNLSAKSAVKYLSGELQGGRFGWVIDADIEGFFDNINHDKLIEMVEHKIHDTPFVRLIRKWLKAGILEPDGKVIHPVTGTPQGGVVSPILANIYLHYVLDLWYMKRVKPNCQGDSKYLRYADDTVWAFQYKREAVTCLTALKERLAEFGLKLSESKTKLIRFSRFGEGENDRFDFLGFEFHWDRSRKGNMVVKKRTSRKKLLGSKRNFKVWFRNNRHHKISEIMETLARKLRGYWNYYGITGNYYSLQLYYNFVMRTVHKWLNRRSGRKSYNWAGINDLFEAFKIPTPKIKPW